MTEVIKAEDCGENLGDYNVSIHKAIIIPEDATNGDMIAAMFPYIEVENRGLITSVKGLDCNKGALDPYRHFWREWWNAPYKAESEEI